MSACRGSASREISSRIWTSLRWTQMCLSIRCLSFWCPFVRGRVLGSCRGPEWSISLHRSRPHVALQGPAAGVHVEEEPCSSFPLCCSCFWDSEPVCCCSAELWFKDPATAGNPTGWISSRERMRRRGSARMMLCGCTAPLCHPTDGSPSLYPHLPQAQPPPSLPPAQRAPLPLRRPAAPHPLWVSAPSLACFHTRPVLQSQAIALFNFSESSVKWLWRTRPDTSAMRQEAGKRGEK